MEDEKGGAFVRKARSSDWVVLTSGVPVPPTALFWQAGAAGGQCEYSVEVLRLLGIPEGVDMNLRREAKAKQNWL